MIVFIPFLFNWEGVKYLYFRFIILEYLQLYTYIPGKDYDNLHIPGNLDIYN